MEHVKLQFSRSAQSSFQHMKMASAASKKSEFSLYALFATDNDITETDIAQLQIGLAARAHAAANAKKERTSNQYKKQQNILYKVLSLATFRQPSTCFLQDAIAMAKTGDLILSRKSTTFSFGSIDESVASGIRQCTNEANFVSTSQDIQQWNQVGVVVVLHKPVEAMALRKANNYYNKIPTTVHDVKYMMHADLSGIKLTELSQVIVASINSKLPVALRRLHVKKRDGLLSSLGNSVSTRTLVETDAATATAAAASSAATAQDVTDVEKIQQMGLLIMERFRGSWYYGNTHFDALDAPNDDISRQAHGSSTQLKPSSSSPEISPLVPNREDADRAHVAKDNEVDVTTMHRDHSGAVAAMPHNVSGIQANEDEELVREEEDYEEEVTLQQDTATDARVLQRFVSVVIERAYLTMMSYSTEEIAEARRAFFLMDSSGDGELDNEEAMQLLSSFIRATTGGGVGESEDDKYLEYQEYLKNYLKSMDTNGDGMLSLAEFLRAYKAIPVTLPNSNLDLPSIMNAEFVACLFTACDILRTEYAAADICYLPHSFSAASCIPPSNSNGSSRSSSSGNNQNSFPALPQPSIFNFFSDGRLRKQQANTVKPLDASNPTDAAAIGDQTRFVNSRIHKHMLWNARFKREVFIKMY